MVTRALALVVLVVGSSAAGEPAPPPSRRLPVTIERAPLEPSVVVVARAAGATTVERYRASGQPCRPGQPVVAIVRLGPAGADDLVTAVATRDRGGTIALEITSRRYVGPVISTVLTTPYVEIELGRLAPGRHRLTVDEVVVDVGDAGWAVGPRRPGLSSSLWFEAC